MRALLSKHCPNSEHEVVPHAKRKNKLSWPSLGATGEFSGFLAYCNRVCVAQLSYSDDVGWFHPSLFQKIAIYWLLEGFGHLEKFRAPTNTRTRKKLKDTLKFLSFVAASKNIFSSQPEHFSFRFWPLVHSTGAEKIQT